MQTTTLRPGLLVGLKTSIRGNVIFVHRDIEPEHTTDDGKQSATWETEKTINDPTEYKLAVVVRSKVRSLVRSVCASSAFGLLCPEQNASDLENAIAEARPLAAEFNTNSSQTRVQVNVIVGKVADTDVEAARAINAEVSELLAKMAEGVRALDSTAVRDAADMTRDLGRMLVPEARSRAQKAIEVGRAAARVIAKAGDSKAQEIDQVAIRRIMEARTAFLDLDEPAAEIGVPTAEGRVVDLGPDLGSDPKSDSKPDLELTSEAA
jgi:hypothetical protein